MFIAIVACPILRMILLWLFGRQLILIDFAITVFVVFRDHGCLFRVIEFAVMVGVELFFVAFQFVLGRRVGWGSAGGVLCMN